LSPTDGSAEQYVGRDWLSVECTADRLNFLTSRADVDTELAQRFPATAQVAVRDATLREIFVGLARDSENAQRRTLA
jgi:hypothetical protein